MILKNATEIRLARNTHADDDADGLDRRQRRRHTWKEPVLVAKLGDLQFYVVTPPHKKIILYLSSSREWRRRKNFILCTIFIPLIHIVLFACYLPDKTVVFIHFLNF